MERCAGIVLAVGVVACSVAACSSGADGLAAEPISHVGSSADRAAAQTVATSADADPVYTWTRVVLKTDGTTDVKTGTITASEQQQQNQKRVAQHQGGMQVEIAQDGTCASDDLWLYDATGQTGDQICFSGTGSTNLDQYCRIHNVICPNGCCGYWNSSVKSYWGATTGTSGTTFDFGYFCNGTTCGNGSDEAWYDSFRQDDAGTVAQNSDTITVCQADSNGNEHPCGGQ